MVHPHITLALVTQARRTISYRPCAVTQAQYFESDKVVTQVQLVKLWGREQHNNSSARL